MAKRITGTVVSWKGAFGFVQEHTAAKTEYYAHFGDLQVEAGGFRALSEGQQVEFEVGQHEGKTRAINVTSIGGAPLPSGQDRRGGGGGAAAAASGGSRGFGGGSRGGRGGQPGKYGNPSPTVGPRVTGTVTFWNDDRNFGFIQDHTAENREHYVHYSVLQVEGDGFRALTKGQEVEFDVTPHNEKTRAVNVTSVGGAPLPAGPKRREGAGGYSGGRGGNERRERY